MFLIKIVPETFHKAQSGSIVGQIWVQIDDFSFPSKAWDDFPIVILAWWLENVTTLWKGVETSCKCLFMDGPYNFEIHVQTNNSWLLRFIKNGKDKNECLYEVITDDRSVVAEMLAAANLAIRTCYEKPWELSDLKILEARYSSLSKMAKGRK